MPPRTSASIPVASRIGGFVYAIRNIVAEARKVEAAGRKVRYLNIGDPIIFGFRLEACGGTRLELSGVATSALTRIWFDNSKLRNFCADSAPDATTTRYCPGANPSR